MRGPRGQHRHGEEFRGGPPWAGGRAGWGGGGRRTRRGDTRQVVLRMLTEGPAHGYEIIRRVEERSAGLWRPSAGSIYPTLQLLEEQGLVISHEEGGKRVYDLTDEGRAQVESQAAGDLPWGTPEGLAGRHQLRDTFLQLGLAARQVAMAADDTKIERATAVLKEARQKLYQMLAED